VFKSDVPAAEKSPLIFKFAPLLPFGFISIMLDAGLAVAREFNIVLLYTAELFVSNAIVITWSAGFLNNETCVAANSIDDGVGLGLAWELPEVEAKFCEVEVAVDVAVIDATIGRVAVCVEAADDCCWVDEPEKNVA
jgi:hypothetical protein